jgi:hypothetical protein
MVTVQPGLWVSVAGVGCVKAAGEPVDSSAAIGPRAATRKAGSSQRLVLVERQGELMTVSTAKAFDRMAAAARQEGVVLLIRDGYRTYAEQVAMARKYGIYGRGGRAAVPGTSAHGRGVALDLDDGRGYRWLRQNAPRFGFRATVPRVEPWHYELVEPTDSGTGWRFDDAHR